jgi:nucleoside 2-deoxyribosyltransferase
MMAYISVSFGKRAILAEALHAVADTLTRFGIMPLLFVDKYRFSPAQERAMMQQAMSAIDSCDLLVAETSCKGIGIGIEVGYAKAKGKPIIYLRHKDAEHSTTVSGISDFQIIYPDAEELKQQLSDTLNRLFPAGKG